MTPDRLNDDQRLLYDCLRDIWLMQSRKIILVVGVALAVGFGLTVGVLMGTRQSIRQSAEIASHLHEQVQQNRLMIDSQDRYRRVQQEQYEALIQAFETVRRQARIDRQGAHEDRQGAHADRQRARADRQRR